MKENKFRAWDEVENKFRTLLDLGDVSGDGSVQFSVGYSGELQIGRLEEFHNGIGFDSIFTKFPIIQYTGLKDKNGKEIFENDIVDYEGFKFTIKKECSSFNLVRTDFKFDMYNMFKNCWNDDVYPLIQLYWEENCEEGTLDFLEVLGNEFENPELLGGNE